MIKNNDLIVLYSSNQHIKQHCISGYVRSLCKGVDETRFDVPASFFLCAQGFFKTDPDAVCCGHFICAVS